jgi:membrane protease YdiL (CAAX protease family)
MLEVVFVSTGVVTLLTVCRRAGEFGSLPMEPFLLTAGAVVPAFLRGKGLSDLGLRLGRLRRDLMLVLIGGACLLALCLAGVLLLKHWSVAFPARISLPRDGLFLWILFQFVYVALPEELFFRGYILSDMGKSRPQGAVSPLWGPARVAFSAGVFAFSHMLTSGDPTALFTFLPGLIFAWLFVKMGSLIPMILLHGAVNIGYALILEMVA